MLGWWQALLELIYPPVCPGCRAGVAQNGYWCQNCLAAHCRWTQVLRPGQNPYLQEVYALTRYDGVIRDLLGQLKFQRKQSVLPALQYLLTKIPLEWVQSFDALVPIPLHAERMSERGFNQVDAIFAAWVQEQQLPYWHWLDRVKSTEYNWHLTVTERRHNLSEAFALNQTFYEKSEQTRRVLLFDDIFTSGVTLTKAAKTLQQAGISRIGAITLAAGRLEI